MKEPVFTIDELYCSYNRDKDKSVLYIPKLDIYRGEILFLLGASGSGKSTLIEVLGLMNNTIAAGKIHFYPDGSNTNLAFHDLWESGDTEKLSKVRKSYMSFIFQDTNLMENFTAYENICLSQMIQSDAAQQNAMKGASELMNKVGLPATQVSENTMAVNLSGGQRQRISFVRALNCGFSVLFGDEPTGNIDARNANELIDIVRQNIGSSATAIIVSHDVELAMRHATRIVCMTKSADGKYSEVRPENIFERKDWAELSPEALANFKNKILALYKNNAVSQPAKNISESPQANLTTKFRSLFFKKEGKTLLGKRNINLLIITSLFIFTFLSIGFANGCIEYLKEKLNDPFVEWITATIPMRRAEGDETLNIVQQLNYPENKEKFHIRSVNEFSEEALYIYNGDSFGIATKNSRRQLDSIANERFPVTGRSIDMGDNVKGVVDPILHTIMDGENRIRGDASGFHDKKDLGIIVTKSFLQDFNYSPNTPVVYMDLAIRDTTGSKSTSRKIPVAVRGVVKEIPGKVRLAYTLYFLKSYLQDSQNPFDTRTQKQIKLVVFGDEKIAADVKRATQNYFNSASEYDQYRPFVNSPIANNDFSEPAFEINVDFGQAVSYQAQDSIFNKLSASQNLAAFKNKYIRFYDYHQGNENFGPVMFDAFSINFSKLDKVRDFAVFFSNKFNDQYDKKQGRMLEIDTAKITEKDNYRFLSNITHVISILLIIFACLSVGLFIFNLIKQHLSNVRMNIGTFKAFGLPDKEAQIIYFQIIIVFIFFSILIAFLIASVSGIVINKYLAPALGLEGLEGGHYFKLLDTYTYITILFIVVSALLVSWFTIRQMLNRTPGDLIYNR